MGGPRRDRLNLSSRFYIEFIINANTICNKLYLYAHIFVYRVTFNYLQFPSCGEEILGRKIMSLDLHLAAARSK